MGKTPDMPKPQKRVSPVTPESTDVQSAGQRKVDELQKRKGRGATFFTDMGMRTGFSGSFGKQTGNV